MKQTAGKSGDFIYLIGCTNSPPAHDHVMSLVECKGINLKFSRFIWASALSFNTGLYNILLSPYGVSGHEVVTSMMGYKELLT